MSHETPGDAGQARGGPSSRRRGSTVASDPPPEEDLFDAAGIPEYSELGDVAGDVERIVREGIEQTERRIRRHPLAAVGLAAGIGVLIGVCLRRGRG